MESSEEIANHLPAKGGGAPAARELLRVEDLEVGFAAPRGVVPVLRRIGFRLRRGEVLALLGESGCGKSLTALTILGLPPAGARVLGGRIQLDGEGDLLALPEKKRRRVRGRRVGIVFQEPASALNPVLTIGFQIQEALAAHQRLGRRARRRRALEWLERVAMPDPERRLGSYPHELSGGQQQRALIAMALASGGDLLLADEPTTALDVTVQAQILDLLLELRRDLGLTILLITHDLGVVAQCSDRVAVMYAGQVVETAPVRELFASPAHPYTRALLAASPRLDVDPDAAAGPPGAIAGTVPEFAALPSGCSFHPRCQEAFAPCAGREPDLLAVAPGRRARCFLHESSETLEQRPAEPRPAEGKT